MPDTISVSTDKEKLDVVFIHNFISQTYWAKGRTLKEVQTAIDNSLNFGIYLADKQIGYARAVTDYIQFAYLMDVFITTEHQKKGYSSVLMKHIINAKKLQKIKTWRLQTTDAQYLYEKFGFKPLAFPDKMMERILPNL